MLAASVYNPPALHTPLPHNTKQTDCSHDYGLRTDGGLLSGMRDTIQGQCFYGVISKPPLANALGAPQNARKQMFLAERCRPHRFQ